MCSVSSASSLVFLTEPESVIVWPSFSEAVELHCIAQPSDAVIRWTLNGSYDVTGHVVTPGSIRFEPIEGGGGLWSDADVLGNGDRVYRCEAENGDGKIISGEAVVSLAREYPSILFHAGDQFESFANITGNILSAAGRIE